MSFDLDPELLGRIIWCICIVIWGYLRWIPNRRSRRKKIEKVVRTPIERFSMIISALGLGWIPSIWVFSGHLSMFDYQTNYYVLGVGAVIFIYSLYLFRVTHKALGAMWSYSLDVREDHKLVTTGIYEKLRHPMYTAFWVWAVAQFFLLPNVVAGIAGVIGFGTLYFLRVGQEEAMMRAEFGEEYDAYCARSKRIIPYLY